MIKILFIDNFDSFTFNLVDEFEKRGCRVLVYRNNIPLNKINKIIKEFSPELIVISPGPGTPKKAGNSKQIIKAYAAVLPIFGVCLGHQAIVEVFGGKVAKCGETIHGKPSKIYHDGKRIFENVENPFQAGRYHSLTGKGIPEELEVSAKTENGIVMGVRHKKYFIEGVQFHPESILTPEGGKIIDNLIKLIGGSKK